MIKAGGSKRKTSHIDWKAALLVEDKLKKQKRKDDKERIKERKIREIKRGLTSILSVKQSALPFLLADNVSHDIWDQVKDDTWGGVELRSNGDLVVLELPTELHEIVGGNVTRQIQKFLDNQGGCDGDHIENCGSPDIWVNYNGQSNQQPDESWAASDLGTNTVTFILEVGISTLQQSLRKVACYFGGANASILDAVILQVWETGVAGNIAMLAIHYRRAEWTTYANAATSLQNPISLIQFGTVAIAAFAKAAAQVATANFVTAMTGAAAGCTAANNAVYTINIWAANLFNGSAYGDVAALTPALVGYGPVLPPSIPIDLFPIQQRILAKE